MSAHRAITVGPFIANYLLNAVDNDAPLVHAVRAYVADGSEAGLHAITAAARHSTGSAAAAMLGITNNIQQEIDAGIPGYPLYNFFNRLEVTLGKDDNYDLVARNKGVDFLLKTIIWTPGSSLPTCLSSAVT